MDALHSIYRAHTISTGNRLRLAVSNHLQCDEHGTLLLGWGDVERLLGGAELLPALHRLDEHSTLLLGWGDVERLLGGAGLLPALHRLDEDSAQLLLSADRLCGERGEVMLLPLGVVVQADHVAVVDLVLRGGD